MHAKLLMKHIFPANTLSLDLLTLFVDDNVPWLYSSFFCHHSAGDKLIDEWKKYLETSQIKEEYGNDEDIMTVIQNLFIIHEEYDSQIDIDFLKDGPYAGHLEDDGGVMFHGKLKSLSFDHVPMDTVKNYLDELVRSYCAR